MTDLDKITREKNILIIDLEYANTNIKEILIISKKNKKEKKLLLNDLENEKDNSFEI